MITESEAKKIIALLSNNWKTYPFDGDSWRTYQRALDDLDYADVERAVDQATRTETFCPVPAVLRNLIGANDDDLGDAETEWGNVLSEIRRVHIYKAPVFANPATDAAVRAMGWPGLCLMEHDEVIANRAHFYATYRAFAKQIKQRKVHEIASGVTPIEGAKPKAVAS